MRTIVLENSWLEHQIHFFLAGNKIAVGCNCQVSPGVERQRKRPYIEARTIFPAKEAIAAYNAWHEFDTSRGRV